MFLPNKIHNPRPLEFLLLRLPQMRKKDLQPAFSIRLCELLEDLHGRGVDGLDVGHVEENDGCVSSPRSLGGVCFSWAVELEAAETFFELASVGCSVIW